MGITLDEFFTSLHHGARSNERFGYWQYFMHASGDETIAEFLAGMLEKVGASLDDGNFGRVIEYVEAWDRRYGSWFVESFPYTRSIVNSDVPWTPLRKPLKQSRVALVCSGGLYREEDEPHGPGRTPGEQAMQFRGFLERHPSYRVIPKSYPRDRIRVSHPSYDYSAVLRDINVLFPLDRFEGLEAEGVIGELANENYSYMGLTSHKRIEEELVPALVEALHAQQVDAVFLTPG